MGKNRHCIFLRISPCCYDGFKTCCVLSILIVSCNCCHDLYKYESFDGMIYEFSLSQNFLSEDELKERHTCTPFVAYPFLLRIEPPPTNLSNLTLYAFNRSSLIQILPPNWEFLLISQILPPVAINPTHEQYFIKPPNLVFSLPTHFLPGLHLSRRSYQRTPVAALPPAGCCTWARLWFGFNVPHSFLRPLCNAAPHPAREGIAPLQIFGEAPLQTTNGLASCEARNVAWLPGVAAIGTGQYRQQRSSVEWQALSIDTID
jgi:hypothetical protein